MPSEKRFLKKCFSPQISSKTTMSSRDGAPKNENRRKSKKKKSSKSLLK
jgi:hypothetical protein